MDPSTQVTGKATNQELGELFGLTICLGERFVDTDEIERLIKANVDKTVIVVDVDGEIQNLFVHSVDDEGFVCDIAAEMTQPPAQAYWIRFTDVREVATSEKP